jgi:nitrogen fixation-related uncharacterized protein
MNVVNRILMILICLTVIAGAVGIIVLAWAIPADTIDGLRNAVDRLEENNQDLEKALLTAIGSVIAFLALVVLLLELTPKTGTEVKVTDLQVGDAVLSTTAIGQRVEEAVRLVPHVADVKATVKTKGKGVAVGMDLHVDPEANVAQVTDEACQAARDVLLNRVHVSMAAPPRARLHYRELKLGRQPQPVLVPPPAPAEPGPPESENAQREPVGAAVASSDETPVEAATGERKPQ